MNYNINFTNQIIKFINETDTIRNRLDKIIKCENDNELVFTFMDKDNEVFKLTLTSQIKNEKVHIVFEYRSKGVSASNDYECAMVLYDSEKSDACIERGLNILMNRKPVMKSKDFDSVLVQGYENFICIENEHMILDYVAKENGKGNCDAKIQHKPTSSRKRNKNFGSHIDQTDADYDKKKTPTQSYENIITKRFIHNDSKIGYDELELSVWFDYILLSASESKTLTTNTLHQLVDKIYTTIAAYCKYSTIIDFTDSYNDYINTPYCIRSNWVINEGFMKTTYILITPQNIDKSNAALDSYITIDMYIKNHDDNSIQNTVSYKISMDDLCSIENLEKLYTAPSFLEKYLETEEHTEIMCFINKHTKDILDEDYRCESILSRRFMFNIVFLAVRFITMNLLSNTGNDIECCTNIPFDILNKYYEDDDRYIVEDSVYDILSGCI